MDESFAALFARAQAGEKTALDQLVGQHLEDLRSFVRWRSGPFLQAVESQSDLLQTVCREALQDLSAISCEDEGAFRSWLFTVAVNKLRGKVEYHSAQRRDPAREESGEHGPHEMPTLDPTPSHQAELNEKLDCVASAYSELPQEFQYVLTEHCILGRSHREIAAALGKSEEAVRKTLSRARARLALRIEAREKDNPEGA